MKSGENPPLVDEPLGKFLVAGDVFEKKLDRDFPAKVHVQGAENLSHSTFSEASQDFVVSADNLVDLNHYRLIMYDRAFHASRTDS